MASEADRAATRGLLRFGTEQRRFEVGGVGIGGLPGVHPTVLIGTIFYHGQKIITDETSGEFDREAAETLIRAKEALVEKTGNPGMLDVVGSTPEALVLHLEYAANTTDMPLLIDGTTTDVRLAGVEYAVKAGLTDRVVYNSLQPGVDEAELKAVGDAGIGTALILAYYLQDFTAAGRVSSVKELLPRVEAAGIPHVIVDTCVLDLATLGQAAGAMFDLKDELGLPVGGGVHNAVAMWRGLKSKMGKEARPGCIAAVTASSVAMGADFVLYGPIEDAHHVFPAVAMMDTALSQLSAERGTKPIEGHPRFRIG